MLGKRGYPLLLLAIPHLGLAASAVVTDCRAQEPANRKKVVLVVNVSDHETGAAVPNVSLQVFGSPVNASSDSSGRALIVVQRRERYSLAATRIGYTKSQVTVVPTTSDTVRVEVSLSPLIHELSGVRVTGQEEAYGARLSAFEGRRARSAAGSFITRADLDQWHTARLTDALRRLPGIWIVDSLDVRLVASSRYRKPVSRGVSGKSFEDLAPCIMRIGVDGQVKEWGFPLDDLPVADIHGVEVYQGPASLPAELGGLRRDAFCGLVMIWTRSR
jgi:TonB-dependent receptor-like protein